MVAAIFLLGMLVVSGFLVKAYQENEQLRKRLYRYDSLASREDVEKQLDSNIHLKQVELEQLLQDEKQLNTKIRSLKQQTTELEEESYLQALGFYKPKYNFAVSHDYQNRFDQVTTKRREMVKSGTAAICRKEWSVGEDVKKGRKLINDYLRVIREAFDAVCDAAIDEAKAANINRLQRRIQTNFEKLNKSSAILECQIAEEYLRLRLEEVDIKYELEMKKQEEKERDRVIREQMVKEKKERDAIEKAKQEEEAAAEKKRQYQQMQDRIQKEMSGAIGKQLEELERQRIYYTELIAKAQKDEDDAIERQRGLKAGFIYVLSSLGSLEKDVYRIFMTQNSEPDKYVKNMNPFVPFPFNIRLKIYSEDVTSTLQQLHSQFDGRRVNAVNPRRDFFKVSLQEIKAAIHSIRNKTSDFRIDIQEPEDIPLENEYIRTLANRENKSI